MAEEIEPKKPGMVKQVFTTLINDATLNGAFRQGLKDVQDAVLVAFPDSMKSRDEPGTIANPTQMIVTEEIKGNDSKNKKYSLDDFREMAKENAKETSEKEQTKQQEMER